MGIHGYPGGHPDSGQARLNELPAHDVAIERRHNSVVKLREESGIEAARVGLGHRSPLVTEIYAEIDQAKAAQVMEKVG